MQLTEECVRDFIARNGGEVLNKDLVRHFRSFFADPATKEEAKQIFKQLVNAVACMKIVGGEKFVVLKSTFIPGHSSPDDGISLSSSGGTQYCGSNAEYNKSGSYLPTHSTYRENGVGYYNNGAQPPEMYAVPDSSRRVSEMGLPYNSYHIVGLPQVVRPRAVSEVHPPGLSQFPPPYHYGEPSIDVGLPEVPGFFKNPQQQPSDWMYQQRHQFPPRGNDYYDGPYPQDADVGLPVPPPRSRRETTPPEVAGRYLHRQPTPPEVAAPPQRCQRRRSYASTSSQEAATPPYRPEQALAPPPPLRTRHSSSSLSSPSSEQAPVVPPRRKIGAQAPAPPPVYRHPDHPFGYGSRLKPATSTSDLPRSAMMTQPRAIGNDPAPSHPLLLRRKSEMDMTDVAMMKNNGSMVDESGNMSVRQRTEQFNKIASSSRILDQSLIHSGPSAAHLGVSVAPGGLGNKKGLAPLPPSTAPPADYLAKLKVDPKTMGALRLALAKQDYPNVARMTKETLDLAHKRDNITGYCPIHWAAKHGNSDLIKLFAGYHRVDVNARTVTGYTALHLAAQFGRSSVFDLLADVFNADSTLRDFAGKKALAYLTKRKHTVSDDTFRKISDRRCAAGSVSSLNSGSFFGGMSSAGSSTSGFETGSNSWRESSRFLRIGSINVRVKKTAEALGRTVTNSWHRASAAANIGPGVSSSRTSPSVGMPPPHSPMSTSSAEKIRPGKKWGSTDSLRSHPSTGITSNIRKRKSRKGEEFQRPLSVDISRPLSASNSNGGLGNAPMAMEARRFSTTSTGRRSSEDSDAACGFDRGWKQ